MVSYSPGQSKAFEQVKKARVLIPLAVNVGMGKFFRAFMTRFPFSEASPPPIQKLHKHLADSALNWVTAYLQRKLSILRSSSSAEATRQKRRRTENEAKSSASSISQASPQVRSQKISWPLFGSFHGGPFDFLGLFDDLSKMFKLHE